MNDILNQSITTSNFGEWSKAYIIDVKEKLDAKFNESVGQESDSAFKQANAKVSTANQEAQLATVSLIDYKKKTGILIVVAVGVFVLLYMLD